MPAARIQGRIVFFDTRVHRSHDRDSYLRASPSRMQGPALAAGQGAVAVVIRSIGTSSGATAHTGMTTFPEGGVRIPAIALSNEDADLVASRLRSGKPLQLHIRSSARFLSPKQSANVIAEIRGTNPAAGIVLIGAHLDSWDVGQGAHDDGAGVAIVMAALAAIRRQALQPRRTIRIVLFANEEFGLTGAEVYARSAASSAEKHAAAIEADSGGDRALRLRSNVTPEARKAVQVIQEILEPLGIALGSNDATGAPDLSPLRARRVPVFDIDQDRTRYFDFHHSAADTIDKIDRNQIRQVTAAYAATIWLLAQYRGSWSGT